MMYAHSTFGTVTVCPSWKQWLLEKLPCALVNIAGYWLCIIFEWPMLILLFLLAMSIYLVYQLLYLKMMRFTFTDEIIVYEHGVFSRRREYIEMYRIIDFQENISLMQYVFNLKTIIIFSGDRTAPTLKVTGVDMYLQLVQDLRQRVEYNKRRKGIYEITNR